MKAEHKIISENKMKGRVSEDEINALKAKAQNINNRIFEIKSSLIDSISRVVQGEYPQLTDVHKLILVKNMYVILSSSIQTLDAEFVEVGKTQRILFLLRGLET